jgi:hypothetical protein
MYSRQCHHLATLILLLFSSNSFKIEYVRDSAAIVRRRLAYLGNDKKEWHNQYFSSDTKMNLFGVYAHLITGYCVAGPHLMIVHHDCNEALVPIPT